VGDKTFLVIEKRNIEKYKGKKGQVIWQGDCIDCYSRTLYLLLLLFTDVVVFTLFCVTFWILPFPYYSFSFLLSTNGEGKDKNACN
jgi:hypothetical protein